MDEQLKSKINLKLFPVYKMFAWDLLFYYSIIFLFLTQIKGFTAAEIVFGDAFYPLFRMLLQFFCVYLVDIFGKKKSLLIGNLLLSVTVFCLMFCNSILILIVLNFLFAIAYNIKAICEPTLLSNSIPKYKKKSNIYSKVDGKGNSLFYYIDAISAFLSGFLFVINPYMPMILCFIFCIISTIISYNFVEIDFSSFKHNKNSSKNDIKNYLYEMKRIFKVILKSKRLLCLLCCSSIFAAIFSIFSTLRSSLLVDLKVPIQYFGIILAICQFISAVSSKHNIKFHNLFKNRLLTWFAFSITISFIFTGLFILCNFNSSIIFMAFGLMLIIVSIITGPYHTLIQRYFNSFSNPSVNTKIYSVKTSFEGFFRFLLNMAVSFILTFTNTAGCFTIIRLCPSYNFHIFT